MLLYRMSRYCYLSVSFLGPTLSLALRHLMRIYSGCDISPKAQISTDLKLPHPLGVVIGDGVVVKDRVMIWQHVTLGSHGKVGENLVYPIVDSGARIYAKASIIGDVNIGKDSIIGAHALVLNDVPSGMVAMGVPAKNHPLRKKNENCSKA